jgi:ELWxxDGT repeat protein
MYKKIQAVFCLSFILTSLLFGQPSMVKDINEGAESSDTPFEHNAFLGIGDTYFFASDDGSVGRELWKSDGTTTGTVLVKDIFPGAESSDLQDFANLNGILLFYANDGTNGMELWRSDGTESGTYMIKDVNTSGDAILSPSFAEILVIGNTAYFRAFLSVGGVELWKTDGTELGTEIVKDIYVGNGSSSPGNYIEMNGVLYFTASQGSPDVGRELFRSDGTEGGTYLVKDINNGIFSSQIENATVVGNTLFFTANDGITGEELWKSDGTEGGTNLVKDINPSGGILDFGYELFAYNNSLLFVANDGTNEADLWISDGTTNGTQLLKEYTDFGDRPPENFEIFNGLVYFYAFDDSADGLWKTDGTTNGTVLVREFSGNTTAVERNIVNLGNQMVLVAKDSNNDAGFELWESDGTESGTTLTGDIKPGFLGSDPANVVNVNGTAFFTADDGTNGRELWKFTPGVVPLSISLSIENEILCFGDADGELLVTVSGGEMPYTYSWTPSSATGNNPLNLKAPLLKNRLQLRNPPSLNSI